MGVSTWATPLDDRIEAFKKANDQTEKAVAWILKTGISEGRAAESLAVVKSWLSANPSKSQSLNFYAGRAMQYSGNLSDTVIFYRRFLKGEPLEEKMAAVVVTATYRLMINDMRDENTAYLFMREEGNRLRRYGRARQFDAWFLRKARDRGDLAATAERLAVMFADNTTKGSDYDEFVNSLLNAVGTFKKQDKVTVAAMNKLATAAAARCPRIKAQWDWIHAVTELTPSVIDCVEKNREAPAELFTDAVKAAKALVTYDPQEARLVGRGWVNWAQGNKDKFRAFVLAQRELKAEVFLEALDRLPTEAARDLLNYNCTSPALYKGRHHYVPIVDFLSVKQRLALARTKPQLVSGINGPDLVPFSPKMSLEDARALAPILASNPHRSAALVRAYAAAGKAMVVDMIPHLMKTERWRFSNAKEVWDVANNSGAERKGADYREIIKQYEAQGARYNQLRKQVAEEADSKSRLAAFDALYKELLGTPSTPNIFSLWKSLMAEAPIADKIQMLKRMTSDLASASSESRDTVQYLLARAVEPMRFGDQFSCLAFGPGFHNAWKYSGPDHNRKNLPEFADHVAALLRKQMQMPSGSVSGPLFGLWLHCADPEKPEAAALVKDLVKSPAYGSLGGDYHGMVRHVFGVRALTEEEKSHTSRGVSRELLALPDKASAAQVSAALQAVLTHASQAPEPVTVIGLYKVAALPAFEGTTRKLALALFNGFSPLGDCPEKQGYEQLGLRLVKDMQKAKEWAEIVPYASSLWRAARVPDNWRYRLLLEALTKYCESALEEGYPSVAFSVARIGLRAQVQGTDRDRLNAVVERATKAMGIVEIEADETDPEYPIHKGNAEYLLGNLETAWKLYVESDALLMPAADGTGEAKALIRKLDVGYLFWLLKRNIDKDRLKQAEELVKELTVWSREDEGLLNSSQAADLQIAYADLAFRSGKLPTARAWYRKVADAREHRGSEAQLRAGLGSVAVDRVSQNFESALTELDRLASIEIPTARTRVHFARAEVLMDQENYKEAFDEIESVLLRDPNHEDAKILQGKIEIQMRRLVEATEIELGVTREDTVIVPGEVLKINLVDPMLNVSGLGADIEVEVQAKSGDRECVMLHPLGDDQTKYRADVPTALGPPTPGDKALQVLGVDEIRYGYSSRFRARMKDLPPDPDTVITIASDAQLAFAAGAFPPRKGERKLTIEELGLSSAQAKLGTRRVRPGNPVYLRIIDPDRSTTAGIDTLPVSLETSSGDTIRRLFLKETGPYSGEFEGVIPTAGAQATAIASESAPGRDPNMSISPKDYPGWLGKVGDRDAVRTFTVDFNDNVGLGKMTFGWLAPDRKITHLALQTSLDGDHWVDRGRYPEVETPWDGRPRVTCVKTKFSRLMDKTVPPDWREQMERGALGLGVDYSVAYAGSLTTLRKPRIPGTWKHRGDVVLRYRALFQQKKRADRRFRLTGYPAGSTVFLIDGSPAAGKRADRMLIERELDPGLHSVEIWCCMLNHDFDGAKPMLLCDVPDKEDLQPCPDSMFDPKSFPKDQLARFVDTSKLTYRDSGLEVAFDDRAQARLVRLWIYGFEGTASGLGKVTLADRDGKAVLPVKHDFMALNDNDQLEVLPGDTIIARYEDPVTATPGRNKSEGRLDVAYNTATVAASFLKYTTTKEGRSLLLEPIRRFNFTDAIAFVIDDVDMDASPERDVVDFIGVSSADGQAKLKAVETEPHSGQFVGRIFPVTGKPQRESELEVPEGGTVTLAYRDMENLDPGIPTDRRATIEHAMYRTPKLGVYTARSELLSPDKEGVSARSLSYHYVDEAQLKSASLEATIGGTVRFDVVVPHLALAGSSTIDAYIQTEAGRRLAAKSGKPPSAPYDITVPGTKKLTGQLHDGAGAVPQGYVAGKGTGPQEDGSALDQGRFSFSVPLVLGEYPSRSFATQAAEETGLAETDKRGLAVRVDDVVHIGYAWKDEQGRVQWKTASVLVVSHGFMDVMNGRYTEKLDRVFVGERIFVRVQAPDLDRGLENDWATVKLKATSGAQAAFRLRETGPHSGVFKGDFLVNYADKALPAELPPVELNGFPVHYGDEVTITYPGRGEEPDHVARVAINKGSNGKIEPFSKRFTGDEMAVQTSFTLSECFFELAKHHKKLEQESLARREMGHAKKLLQEAIATHRDDKMRAQAEYLLGNLAQEYGDLAKNDPAKLPMYKEALSRFSKIPVDYPETDFANKAQFKTALVYEKMGESEISVGEYVKLAYKYPNSEHIPEAMSRLGMHFQKIGQAYKDQADPLRDKTDVESLGEVVRLDKLAAPEFIKAAIIYGKLLLRFPDHKLAGLAGLASAMNYMRAHKYETAIEGFTRVVDNEDYDDLNIRAQALFWQGLCYEKIAGFGAWTAPRMMEQAGQLYRRVTFDFPDSEWAKRARGRLASVSMSKKKKREYK